RAQAAADTRRFLHRLAHAGLGVTQRALDHRARLLVELLEADARVAARLAGIDLELLELLHERLPLGIQSGHSRGSFHGAVGPRALIAAAVVRRRSRTPTRPTGAAREQRLGAKRVRSTVKRLRARPGAEE